MFILSRLSRVQFRLNKSSEEPEHATLAAIAPLLGRCLVNNIQIWSRYFIPVVIRGACAIMRVSVVPGKLMLLIGKDTA